MRDVFVVVKAREAVRAGEKLFISNKWVGRREYGVACADAAAGESVLAKITDWTCTAPLSVHWLRERAYGCYGAMIERLRVRSQPPLVITVHLRWWVQLLWVLFDHHACEATHLFARLLEAASKPGDALELRVRAFGVDWPHGRFQNAAFSIWSLMIGGICAAAMWLGWRA